MQRNWSPRSAIDYRRTSFRPANASRRGGTMVSWNREEEEEEEEEEKGGEEETALFRASYKCISIEINPRQSLLQ
jgi:hypothetical protein